MRIILTAGRGDRSADHRRSAEVPGHRRRLHDLERQLRALRASGIRIAVVTAIERRTHG
jgi:hypothetical protein